MKNCSIPRNKSVGFILTLSVLFFLISLSGPAGAQEEPVFVLEEMDQELILGQRARSSWGHFWSGPAVSAINFGYLAEHGYQKLAADHNGSGGIEAGDIEPLAEKLGREYMGTDPDTGTTDPELLRGIARYVGENYPDRFQLKVYEGGFREEYQGVVGEGLPDELYDVRVTVFTDPEFKVYEKELRAGEMVWVGVPQENSPNNHYLAGRSLDNRETMGGNYPVDFGEPKEKSFQPGKGQIIETVMSEGGNLDYAGRTRPVDILIALSPLEEKAQGDSSDGPDLECSFNCEEKTEEICVEYRRTEPECKTVCTGWDGDLCYETKQVCEEGARVCAESIEKEVLVCDTKVKNTGGKETGLNTGRLIAGGKEKHFVTTPLAPGEEQSAGKATIGLDEFEADDLVCRVDIYNDVEEVNEENNEANAAE